MRKTYIIEIDIIAIIRLGLTLNNNLLLVNTRSVILFEFVG